MRFASFIHEGKSGYGRVEGDAVLPPSAAFAAAYPSLKAALAGAALARFEPGPAALPLAALVFAPVIPDPAKILCIGQNYKAHGDGAGLPDHPPVFTRFADTQAGHNAPIVIPAETGEFELEGELALIIGRPGRAIPVAEAPAYVAGYCCYNDASARDWQSHSSQLVPGKNFPQTGGCGPFLVTPDEVGNPDDLALVSRVDGVVHQKARTADMLFGTAALIAYVSRFTPLSPGDIIVTGTPARTPAGEKPNSFLKPGSVVEIEIEKVGCLSNPLVAEG